MNAKTLAILALALWAGSAAFVGFKFMTGSTLAGADGREAIVLNAGERDFILEEMRGMLIAVQEILAAVNANDMEGVKTIAHRVGIAEVDSVAPETMLKLPMAFKRLGRSTHEGFDEVGIAAEFGGDAVLQALEVNLNKCVACHEAYSLVAK